MLKALNDRFFLLVFDHLNFVSFRGARYIIGIDLPCNALVINVGRNFLGT